MCTNERVTYLRHLQVVILKTTSILLSSLHLQCFQTNKVMQHQIRASILFYYTSRKACIKWTWTHAWFCFSSKQLIDEHIMSTTLIFSPPRRSIFYESHEYLILA